jgi:hypothetical protein
MRFRVAHVSIEPNVRGDEMRRVHLTPLPHEAFAPVASEALTTPAPDAHVTLLLNPEAAQRFALGDEFDLMLREREQ